MNELFKQPYFIANTLACMLYMICRLIAPIRTFVFGPELKPDFDNREVEILVFLAVLIAVRSKRIPNTGEFVSRVFLFCKFTNVVLFYRLDQRLALAYVILWMVLFVLVPEKEYAGENKLDLYTPATWKWEIERAKKSDKEEYVLAEFYTTFSPPCVHLAKDFSQLSVSHTRDFLKFAKLDVGRYPALATAHNVKIHPTAKELPTLALFQNGEEIMRRPMRDSNGVQHGCSLNAEAIAHEFGLNEIIEVEEKKLKTTEKDAAKGGKGKKSTKKESKKDA